MPLDYLQLDPTASTETRERWFRVERSGRWWRWVLTDDGRDKVGAGSSGLESSKFNAERAARRALGVE